MVVVGGLLLAALIVGLVLWATSGSDQRTTTTVAGAATTVPAGGGPTTVAPAASGIAALRLYDPDGDGTEQQTNVALADDGNTATAWTTVCYKDRFLGGKSGLGIVADLGSAQSGTVTADIASGPYQVQILTAPGGDAPPAAISGWATADKRSATSTGTITATVTNARWVGVIFNELGQDGSCTKNRFRGRISEISFQPG